MASVLVQPDRREPRVDRAVDLFRTLLVEPVTGTLVTDHRGRRVVEHRGRDLGAIGIDVERQHRAVDVAQRRLAVRPQEVGTVAADEPSHGLAEHVRRHGRGAPVVPRAEELGGGVDMGRAVECGRRHVARILGRIGVAGGRGRDARPGGIRDEVTGVDGHDREHEVRTAGRERGRHRATERVPHDDDGPADDRIDERTEVGDERRNVVAVARRTGCAMPALVVRDDPVCAAEVRQLPRPVV